nr:hypothetical protein CFP56_67389 [Quercus suber]
MPGCREVQGDPHPSSRTSNLQDRGAEDLIKLLLLQTLDYIWYVDRNLGCLHYSVSCTTSVPAVWSLLKVTVACLLAADVAGVSSRACSNSYTDRKPMTLVCSCRLQTLARQAGHEAGRYVCAPSVILESQGKASRDPSGLSIIITPSYLSHTLPDATKRMIHRRHRHCV